MANNKGIHPGIPTAVRASAAKLSLRAKGMDLIVVLMAAIAAVATITVAALTSNVKLVRFLAA